MRLICLITLAMYIYLEARPFIYVSCLSANIHPSHTGSPPSCSPTALALGPLHLDQNRFVQFWPRNWPIFRTEQGPNPVNWSG